MALVDNLIAFWELEESGGTRNDSHGTNHLTDNNTVLSATGKVGTAADFERDNSEYLSIADNAALSVGDIDFTFCAWVNMETKTNEMDIFSKYDPPINQRSYRLIYDPSPDRFLWAISSDGIGGDELNADVLGSPSTATWYFIVADHDATANTMSVQVNNGTASSRSHTGGAFDNTASFLMGNMSSSTNYWDGLIDQVGFWKRLLNSTEKTFLYNSGAGRSYAEINPSSGLATASYRRFPKLKLRQPIEQGRTR